LHPIYKTNRMQKEVIQLHNVTPENLKKEIVESIKEVLYDFLKKESKEDKLLTRSEVAKALAISLPTLRSYVKRGIIKEHRVGSRVLYKWNDVNDALSHQGKSRNN